MNLLCIDTTGRALVLALVSPERPLVGRVVDTEGKHAEVLLPELGALLHEAELDVGAVSAVGVTVGPGGFTSIRVGLATAKGLCVARERALYATSSLRALAYGAPLASSERALWAALSTRVGAGAVVAAASTAAGPESVASAVSEGVAVLTRAYRGEVYAALYAAGPEGLRELVAPLHASPPDALGTLSDAARDAGLGPVYVTGDGVELVRAECARGDRWRLPPGPAEGLTPEALAAAIVAEVNAGRTQDVVTLGPDYLRPPDAALPTAR
ncbi:MAG: tRNA (adenosine(37)-N6)-threonylcarbamoyltransferase complex dimerization subunit type 1 TsaB [Myxococcales bacterium]|nr:tRNA (adenosine(37)-N6)-threonylcarbamoyltransferase complex dimerization subunit type 1 TsaB [Myxococcales bacterium]MCB9628346.1 tRNA (adenosine(37)-N6)-threonylcarbamoyltransferase complex dimerization subunit type 1 TsaB [Sandaracinaceae bacterium]